LNRTSLRAVEETDAIAALRGDPRRRHPAPGATEKEMSMKTLRFLDSSGDLEIEFDESETLAEARAEAERLFARALAGGAVAFSVNRAGGAPDAKVNDFSALEDETVVVPRIVGG
jgi:hypothetical protein